MGICGSAENQKPKTAKSSEESDYVKRNYSMGRTLGKGGSCRVVEVTHKIDARKYALKIMSRAESMNQELFDKERSILLKLSDPEGHPNIINLHETKVDKSHFYIWTNLCTGGELFDRIVDKKNPITEARAAKLVQTMLLAVQHCHKKNIVHRDLKPENFVFRDKSQDSDMVLIDFGCAKEVEDDTIYQDLVGTPYYLAPESAAGHKYKRTGSILKASDVWSIGVIAYVLMTGRPPFNGSSNTDIFASIIKKPLKFPSGVSVPPTFKKFVKAMLKKSPKQRVSLTDAIKHDWVNGTASDRVISNDVIKVLRQFNQQSKLKKAITKTLAQHMGKEPEEKIRDHFNRLDTDNSGALDQNELALLLEDMGYSKEEAKVEAKKIIKETDDDGSNEIEFVEFAQIWQRKLLSVNESYIHAVFTVLDENGDGSIDADELKKVLEIDDEDEINAYIKEVDTDNDGQISFAEFKKAMQESGAEGKIAGKVGYELNEKELASNVDQMGEVDLENEGAES